MERKSAIAMNEDNETTNETKQNKRLKKQDKNNSSKHHKQVQRTNKTDLLDQVSLRQEQILWYYDSSFCTTYIKANLIVLNFVQSKKYISNKDIYSTK